MKKSIINLVIALIIVLQVAYFYKNTTNDVLLNVSAKQESNDIALVHLDKVIDILLKNVDSKQNNNFFIITNKETLPYEAYGIGYLYLRWKLYPNFLPTIGEYNAVKATPEYIDSIGKNYDLDYVFVLGKDTNFFGYTTEADVTLFHLDNKESNQYSYVDQINLSLYDLYNHDKQLSLFGDNKDNIVDEKNDKLQEAMDKIRDKYGNNMITYADMIDKKK